MTLKVAYLNLYRYRWWEFIGNDGQTVVAWICKSISAIIIIIIIQLRMSLLTCRINITSANCKARTKTQIQHENSTYTKRNHKTKQKQYGSSREKQYKRSTVAETQKPENRKVYSKIPQINAEPVLKKFRGFLKISTSLHKVSSRMASSIRTVTQENV